MGPLPRIAYAAVCAALLATLYACDDTPPVPGDEAMGNFRFTATRLGGDCAFAELDGGTFSFEGAFSRFQSGEGAWFTVNGLSREGHWDGQVFESPYTAARRFEVQDAGAVQFTTREELKVALLSDSQQAALGNDCPQDVLPLFEDGGVPVDVDAGIYPPGTRTEGFDAARACGLLTYDIAPAEVSEVAPCIAVYRAEGVRTR